MAVFETIMGVMLIIMAIFLVVAVLMQHGKDHHLSGTIAGGAENFFGKTKGKKIDKTLGNAPLPKDVSAIEHTGVHGLISLSNII